MKCTYGKSKKVRWSAMLFFQVKKDDSSHSLSPSFSLCFPFRASRNRALTCDRVSLQLPIYTPGCSNCAQDELPLPTAPPSSLCSPPLFNGHLSLTFSHGKASQTVAHFFPLCFARFAPASLFLFYFLFICLPCKPNEEERGMASICPILQDCWLLSDLDGTLIATPHKAHGRYLPITESPCFTPMVEWLRRGGNVCVVTTADMRVVDQVYRPLQPYLKTQKEMRAEAETASRRCDTNAVDGQSLKESTAVKRRGYLLLSLYTGAVLYWCTADTMQLLPGYASGTHCATRESVELSKKYQVEMLQARILETGGDPTAMPPPPVMQACVRGTCIDRRTAQTLQDQITTLYATFIKDVLLGAEKPVVEAMQWLSQRYKRMWSAVLQYLDLVYRVAALKEEPTSLHLGGRTSMKLDSSNAMLQQRATSTEEVQWKLKYLNSCQHLLTALGILRIEHVEEQISSGQKTESGGVGSASPLNSSTAEAADHELLVSHAVATLQGKLPRESVVALKFQIEEFADYIVRLLCPSAHDLRYRKEHRDISGGGADIAQIIVLGLPLRLFSRYFRSSTADFARCGVNAMPQPNSVVFSKMGVSKSTALRYLLGKDRVAPMEDALSPTGKTDTLASAAPHASPVKCTDSILNFSSCIDSRHAVAMGDNPQSTDYELTVFRDVVFLSVEKESQRVERQRRILRRLGRTQAIEREGNVAKMPDGSPAPSYVDLVGSLRRSGPMMDDRLFRNITYVGDEENGTAVFLTELVKSAEAEVRSAAAGDASFNSTGPVTEEQFQRAINLAQAKSRDTVMSKMRSKV